jgi:dihydroflavonol-4-reductase
MHVASPISASDSVDEEVLIRPAVDGTLRALNAAKVNKAKKVILTSSVASIFYDDSDKKNYDENDWSDIDSNKITPYAKSKTMAEKSAWEFIDNLGEDVKFPLTVFCPYMVLGPALSPDLGGTNVLVQMLTSGKLPGTPNIHLGIVDVRDVAQAHVDAISNQGSNNERFILCTSSFWLHEISQILIKAGFTKAPKLRLPNFVLRFAALFSATARESVRMLGDPQFLSNEKVKTILNWQPRPVEETLVDTAKSLEGQDQISIP